MMDELYAELRPDIEALATPLFEMSEELVIRRGNFLPHGAVLAESGGVQIFAATPESGNDLCTAAEVLPILHGGLRNEARSHPLRAIGIAENVTVTRANQRPTQAIKVLVEHRRGLTVALYVPFKRKLLRGFSFGEMFSVEAAAEVKPWPTSDI
jgi:hypothetical protein